MIFRPTPSSLTNQIMSPRYSKTIKKISRSQLDIIQFTKYVKRETEQTPTYLQCFQYIQPQILVSFSHPNTSTKTHLRTDTHKLSPQTWKKQTNRKNMTPNRLPKSFGNQYKSNPGAQGLHFGVPVNPSTTNWWGKVHKAGPQGTKISPQNFRIDPYQQLTCSTKHQYQ